MPPPRASLPAYVCNPPKKKIHPQRVWWQWLGPTHWGQISLLLDWRNSSDFWISGKLREQRLSPAACCDTADFHMLDSFACLLFWPAKPLPGCYSVSPQQIRCQSHQSVTVKNSNKYSLLHSKDNACSKGLKYNLYHLCRNVRCSASLLSLVPPFHFCSCLNSLFELHLRQLSEPWKKAVGAQLPLLLLKVFPVP